jgi:hypothetical protein
MFAKPGRRPVLIPSVIRSEAERGGKGKESSPRNFFPHPGFQLNPHRVSVGVGYGPGGDDRVAFNRPDHVPTWAKEDLSEAAEQELFGLGDRSGAGESDFGQEWFTIRGREAKFDLRAIGERFVADPSAFLR